MTSTLALGSVFLSVWNSLLLVVIITDISDKAWGHSKKAFYNSDYVDEDLEDSEEEEMLAQEEEKEGLALQRRMAESLQDHDFGLNFLPVSNLIHMNLNCIVPF